MDSFINELRKGIDKTETVKNDIKREQRILNNGLSSDIIKAVQGDVTKLINSSKSILDTMIRMSINLNTAKTEFINADKNSVDLKALHPKRIYMGDETSKETTEKADLLPNAKLEKDILRWVFQQAVKSKVESDIVKSKLKVGDFDGASIELTGMDLENVLNALTMGEAGAAIEGFQTLFKLGTKGYRLLKIGITGAKEALSKLTVEKVALAFTGAKGLEQIEETAENIKKEEGIIKTALESAKRKLDDLYKIVYDGESDGKEKVKIDGKTKGVGNTLDDVVNKYSDDIYKYDYKEGVYKPIEVTTRNYDKIDEVAEEMYDLFRGTSDDVEKIAENTGWDIKDINQIKEHVFLDKVMKDSGMGRLDPDYEMAIAWERLEKGEFYDNDILLLKHELYESTYYRMNNCTQREAHDATTKIFDWNGYVESLR
ncbi:hypothetical protein [Clostridium felsineum]|nr:hypothetical protein [Clostridium felsineum]